MGMKIWILGTTVLASSYVFGLGQAFSIAGVIVMIVGTILLLLDK
jgi:hypothetical protein